jgi:ribosomal protein S12 methylthiotransferase
MKFDKMGVFTYSREENTYSYNLPNQIDEEIKQGRKDKLMELQSKISLQINESMIGSTVPCIVEALTQDGVVVARTYKDAPEIDGVCYISTDEPLVPGDIELVEITDADEYDLWGVING